MPNAVHEASRPVSGNSVSANTGVVILSVPCAADVYVGSCVRMSGINAVNALADDLTNSNVLGFVFEKPTTTTCHVRLS